MVRRRWPPGHEHSNRRAADECRPRERRHRDQVLKQRRRAAIAFAIFLGLAILHTWPLSSAPGKLSLNDNADAQLNEWIVSWIAHTLPFHPAQLFNGNIFAPEPRTLAYSEPLIAPALAGAPLRWLGASPVLTFNVLLIGGLTLTALSAWFVVFRWTGSSTAGLVAGTLAAFNVHLLTRLPHLQAAHAWGLPLIVYFADRLANQPRRPDVLLLGLVVTATAVTSLYWLVFAGLIIAAVLFSRRPTMHGGAGIAAATTLGLLLALPVLWPFIQFARGGATRPLEIVALFSATPAGFLVSTSRLYAKVSSGWFRDPVNVFFPGVTALALSAFGFLFSRGAGLSTRRQVRALVIIAAAGVLLSFGPSTPIYRWLYEFALPLRGIRAAARFAYLLLLAVALMSGFGVAWVERRVRSPAAARLMVPVVLLLVTAEVWQGPVPAHRFAGIPPIYSLLRDTRAPVVLVEVPFYPPDTLFENGEYVLNATAHWQPVMNGYSGYTPDSYRARADVMWLFPAAWALQAIHREGATHLMVHLERFGSDVPEIERTMAHEPGFRLMAADTSGHRLYEVKR